MISSPRLILASASPRRRALLEQAGFAIDAVIDHGCNETMRRGETPPAMALRLACAKVDRVADQLAADHDEWIVVGADTVVYCAGRVIPKPDDSAAAAAGLRRLSGRAHRVTTAVALRCHGNPVVQRRSVTTRLLWKRLSEVEIRDYLASGEWQGCAGGYAIQGRAAAFVTRLAGSYEAVMGLPLYQTTLLLEGAGLHYRHHDSASFAL